MEHAVVAAVEAEQAGRAEAGVDEDLVRVGEALAVHDLRRAAEDRLELAVLVEDEDPALAVAVDDVDVAVRGDVAARELQGVDGLARLVLRLALVGREGVGLDLHDDGAVELGLKEALLAEHGAVEELAFGGLADREAVERHRQREGLEVFAVLAVDLDAGVLLLDADVDEAGGIDGDLAVAVADGLLARRRAEEVRDEFILHFGGGGGEGGHGEEGEEAEGGHGLIKGLG